MTPVLAPLASRIVDQIPMLLERLRDLESQEAVLDARCQQLENELLSHQRYTAATTAYPCQLGRHETAEGSKCNPENWSPYGDGELLLLLLFLSISSPSLSFFYLLSQECDIFNTNT